MFTKAIVCTDFSPMSKQLVDTVKELQKVGLQEIHLVHVIDIGTGAGSATMLAQHNQGALEQEKKRFQELGVKVESHIPIGKPTIEINKLAKETDASLIIIASHGKGFIKQVFLGSTTVTMVRTSETPILVEKFIDVESPDCKPFCPTKLDKLLVAVDLSDCVTQLLDKVLEYSQHLKEVVLVSAVESSNDPNEFELIKSMYVERLAEIQEKLLEKNVSVKSLIRKGAASTNIMDIAHEEEVSMIMMGTRGEGVLERMLLGSTAETVVKKSRQPVYLFPCGNS